MSHSADGPRRRSVHAHPKLPEVQSPSTQEVLDGAPSTEQVVQDAQDVDEIVREQPTVEDLLGNDRA